jgi:excisionase family DNA binding protein
VDREAREEVALRRKAPTFGEVLRQLARVERLLQELLDRDHAAERRAEPKLLSKREAARRLRVDRGSTLEDLVRAGRLRTVPALSGNGVRIPSQDVERLLGEGLQPNMAPPARRRRDRARGSSVESGSEIARRIRAIPIPRQDEG